MSMETSYDDVAYQYRRLVFAFGKPVSKDGDYRVDGGNLKIYEFNHLDAIVALDYIKNNVPKFRELVNGAVNDLSMANRNEKLRELFQMSESIDTLANCLIYDISQIHKDDLEIQEKLKNMGATA